MKVLLTIIAVLGVLWLIMFLGRPKSGPPVQFVLPEGFTTGFIMLIEDKEKGQPLPPREEEIVLVSDPTGLIIVKDLAFREVFRQYRALRPDGTIVDHGVPSTTPADEVALYGLGGRSRGHWWIIGTLEDYERARRDRDLWTLQER